jgi:hypothetical protein
LQASKPRVRKIPTTEEEKKFLGIVRQNGTVDEIKEYLKRGLDVELETIEVNSE